MECRECGCTDQAACPGGCQWVWLHLCSKCIPTSLDFRCSNKHVFDVEIREDASIIVDGDEVGAFSKIECPECGSGDVVDTYHVEEVDGVVQ